MNFENFSPQKKLERLPSEISLVDCELSIRAYQFLEGIGITNLAELAACSEEELLEKGKNPKTVKEVKELLQENNLSLKKDSD